MATARTTLRGTKDEVGDSNEDALAPRPGLAVIFSGKDPLWHLLPLEKSPQPAEASSEWELVLGRDNLEAKTSDGRISRRHARVAFRQGGFTATDLGSMNGTIVDGSPTSPQVGQVLRHCLRLGDTLLIPVADLNPFEGNGLVMHDRIVVGPRLALLYQRIARLAAISPNLHITGESGAGKENAARSFHQASAARSGPFVAVNCATIPESIAERLLFGAKRGAFSGVVADSDGYVQSAHGGTLFLDEVAELHAAVQAKLLRVLETREVLAVGAVRPQPVNIRVCSASHRSLHTEVAAGRLREDLYYRLGRPSECVPALRERPEEIPWLIQSELQRTAPKLTLHVSLIEACILRHWPGNVRELLIEIRAAVQEAIAAGASRIKVEHLADRAGQVIRNQPLASGPSPEPARPSEPADLPSVADLNHAAKRKAELPTKAQIIAALLDTKCNISEAARRLGIHRTQLRRQMEQLGVELDRLRQLDT